MATAKRTVRKKQAPVDPSEMKTFLILGGYGNAGRFIAAHLLRDKRARVILAGRNLTDATVLAGKLCLHFGQGRAEARYADAEDKASLPVAMEGADMVIVAAPVFECTDAIVEAACEKGIDYFDILLSTPFKHGVFTRYQEVIKKKKILMITDGGSHPGMAAPMAKMMASMFEKPIVVDVASCFRLDWRNLPIPPVSVNEFAQEMTYFDPSFYRDGQWYKLKNSSMPPQYDFGDPFQIRYCTPMMMAEMREIPKLFPTLRHTGFYVAGFNGITDWLIMPICYELVRRFPANKKLHAFLGKFFYSTLKLFSFGPYGSTVQVIGIGVNHSGKEKRTTLRITHHDAYELTAISAAACLQEYLNGNFDKYRGKVCLQGSIVEPELFVSTMRDLGAKVSIV